MTSAGLSPERAVTPNTSNAQSGVLQHRLFRPTPAIEGVTSKLLQQIQTRLGDLEVSLSHRGWEPR
jgi:hypothetical protein